MWSFAVVAMLAAMPASAPAPGTPCATVPPKPPAPKLSAFEQTVRRGMAVRRAYAMRVDRRWVVRVLRSPRMRFEEGFGPAAPREIRYLRLRDRIIEATGVIEAHLRRQPVAVDAGYDIEEDPDGPFLIYKVSGDRDRLARELRERFPYPAHLEVVEVEYSVRELDAVRDRVFDDMEALEREGIELSGGGVDTASNRAEIEVITRRTDAQELLAARYGPSIRVKVIAKDPDRLVCTRVAGYQPRRGGRVLELAWTTNSVYELERIEVTETAREVRIGVVERAPNGPVTLAGLSLRRRVQLAAPLGGRRVLAARSGRPLRTMRECARRWDIDPDASVCLPRRSSG